MQLPVINLSLYLESKEGKVRDLCGEVSWSLRETRALLVKDPRCTAQDNDPFLDMMERYLASPSEFKRLQERPQLHYQIDCDADEFVEQEFSVINLKGNKGQL